jgi:hypothetical protein
MSGENLGAETRVFAYKKNQMSTVVLSGLVMRWRVDAAPAGGRRPLLIFNWRWESLGQVS